MANILLLKIWENTGPYTGFVTVALCLFDFLLRIHVIAQVFMKGRSPA